MSPPAVMLLDNELRNCEIFEKLISGAGAYASQQAQIASSSTANNTNTSSSSNNNKNGNGNNEATRGQPPSDFNNNHHATHVGHSLGQSNPPTAATAPAPSSFPPPPSVEVFSVGGDVLHWLYVYQMSFSFVDTLGGVGANAILHFALRMPTRARNLVTGSNNEILRAFSRASSAVLTLVHLPFSLPPSLTQPFFSETNTSICIGYQCHANSQHQYLLVNATPGAW